MDYDRELDEHIIEVLEENGGTKRFFNELLKILNGRYYTKGTKLRPRTLTKHLDIMEKQEIIERDPKKPYKRYVWLHPNTIIQRKYNFFNGVEGVRTTISKEEKKKEKDRKLALFLMLFLGYGRDRIIGDSIDKFLHYKEAGFSASDLKRNAVGSSPIQSLFAFNKFGEDEIEDMFKEISEYHDIPLRKYLTSDNKEIGYYINDEILESFLYWCVEILVVLIRRMEKEWYFLFKKPTRDESSWLYFVCGKESVTNLFTKIEDNKTKKKTVKELYIEYYNLNENRSPERLDRYLKMLESSFPDYFTKRGVKKDLDIADRRIQQDLEFIDSNKNKEYFLPIKTRYGWILDSIKDIIRPRFSKRMYASNFFDK